MEENNCNITVSIASPTGLKYTDIANNINKNQINVSDETLSHLQRECKILSDENNELKIELEYYRKFSNFLNENFYRYARQSFEYLNKDENKESSIAIDVKRDMYLFCLFILSNIKNDEFYGVLARNILSDHSNFFEDDLTKYKELPNIHKGLVNDNDELKSILEESYKGV